MQAADMTRRAVIEGVALAWKTSFAPRIVSDAMLKDAQRLAEERYRTEEWNKRR